MAYSDASLGSSRWAGILGAFGLFSCAPDVGPALSTSIEKVNCSMDSYYAEVMAAKNLGDGYLEADNPRAAIEAYDKAIAILGDRYRTPGEIDDTVLRLSHSKWIEADGQISEAAVARRELISSRLASYDSKCEGSADQN